MRHLPQLKIVGVPYTFRGCHQREPKLTSQVVFNYFAQLAGMYRRLHRGKMGLLKYCMLGITTIILNRLVFLTTIHAMTWCDWRLSALASSFAVLTNFLWLNRRIRKDRSLRKLPFFCCRRPSHNHIHHCCVCSSVRRSQRDCSSGGCTHASARWVSDDRKLPAPAQIMSLSITSPGFTRSTARWPSKHRTSSIT